MYSVGRPLQLHVALGGDCLELCGVVAWTQPQEGLLGVRFVHVPEEAGHRLEALVWVLTGLMA
jgi:hypothetical protein